MNQTLNSFLEEDSSSICYLNDTDIKLKKNMSEFLPTVNQKESEKNLHEIFNEKMFSKEFNKVFAKSEKLKTIDENKYDHILKKNTIASKKKCFPFNEGEGIKNCLEKLGYNVKFITNNKISILDAINPYKKKLRRKFDVIDFSSDENGKIKKVKYKRRYAPDDIRKKIKSKFHKSIKNIINLKLKRAGSSKLFVFFPQNFVSNITVKLNKMALNYTYEELIKTNLASELFKFKANSVDISKHYFNLEVLNYLDENPLINELSSFNIIRKMKYKALLKAFFISKEFENSIIELNQKGEKMEYIEKYVNVALRYVHFFSSKVVLPINKKKRNKNLIQIIYDDEDEKDINNE